MEYDAGSISAFRFVEAVDNGRSLSEHIDRGFELDYVLRQNGQIGNEHGVADIFGILHLAYGFQCHDGSVYM